MTKPARTKNRVSPWPTLLLVLGLGWVLYSFVNAELVPLRDTPPPKPTVISRAKWKARPLDLAAPEEFNVFEARINPGGVLYYPGDLIDELNTIVIHHSATAYSSPSEVQDLHMDGRGFADIAYHFLIDPDGIIYEGRELNIRGAHVQGFNTGSVGIVLLGNFNDEKPGETQFDSLRALVDYLRYTYQIRYLAGHKDYPGQSPDGTECPGNNLYPLLSNLARELGMKYGIDGYVIPEWIRYSRNEQIRRA